MKPTITLVISELFKRNRIFVSRSKVKKLNSKSSTDAEINDGMNVPLWLADSISHQERKAQPVRLEQDDHSCIALLNKRRSTAETTRFILFNKEDDVS